MKYLINPNFNKLDLDGIVKSLILIDETLLKQFKLKAVKFRLNVKSGFGSFGSRGICFITSKKIIVYHQFGFIIIPFRSIVNIEFKNLRFTGIIININWSSPSVFEDYPCIELIINKKDRKENEKFLEDIKEFLENLLTSSNEGQWASSDKPFKPKLIL